MLFTGIIAALLARFTDHPARHQPPAPTDSPRERDEDEPKADSRDPHARRC
ncbi:hypothetical protein [Labrys neptuniae]